MFTKLEFYVGLLVGGAFATFTFMVGGIAASTAAIGIPSIVGLVGTIVLVVLRLRARRPTKEMAA